MDTFLVKFIVVWTAGFVIAGAGSTLLLAVTDAVTGDRR